MALAAAPGGRGGERLARAAAAVELVHMASLVHDDVIDGAAMRRGRATVAASSGTATAILLGDHLLTRAFAEVAGTGDPAAVTALADAVSALTRAEAGQADRIRDLSLTAREQLALCEAKTGALFAVACRLGARVGGAGAETQRRMGEFGARLGAAFQVLDDAADLSAPAAVTGKQPGADLRAGVVTLPVILAVEAEPRLRGVIERAWAGEAVGETCARLARHPAVAQARGVAEDLAASALRSLAAVAEPVDHATLRGIAWRVLEGSRAA